MHSQVSTHSRHAGVSSAVRRRRRAFMKDVREVRRRWFDLHQDMVLIGIAMPHRPADWIRDVIHHRIGGTIR